MPLGGPRTQRRVRELVCIHARNVVAHSTGTPPPECFVTLACPGDVPFYVTPPAAGIYAWGEYTSCPIRPAHFAPWARGAQEYASEVHVALWRRDDGGWARIWECVVDLRDLEYADSLSEVPNTDAMHVVVGLQKSARVRYAALARPRAATDAPAAGARTAPESTPSYTLHDTHRCAATAYSLLSALARHAEAHRARQEAAADAVRSLCTGTLSERASAEIQAATARADERAAACRAALSTDHADHAARRAALAQRRERVASVQREAQILAERERDLRSGIDAAKRRLEDASRDLARARARTLRMLEEIFPIELVDARQLLYSIAGIPLATGARWTALDDAAAALGLVAQLVVLLSTYLATPLPYPIVAVGSRAVIKDGISVMRGPRVFTLYMGRGIEPYRYEYAVFLLSKDIEQLMNAHGVPVLDLRALLPNLKNLLATLVS